MKHFVLLLGFCFITIAIFAGFVRGCKNIIWDIKHHEYKSLIINVSILIMGVLFYFYILKPIDTIKGLFPLA